jgi:hypothetical protein
MTSVVARSGTEPPGVFELRRRHGACWGWWRKRTAVIDVRLDPATLRFDDGSSVEDALSALAERNRFGKVEE